MQRIALTQLEHTVTRRWKSQRAVVLFGTAAERWFCWRTGKGDAYVSADERSVADVADRWLARGTWSEVSLQSAAASDPSPAPQARGR